MNILFINYGQAGNNSSWHMQGFAAAAGALGHDCAMAAVHGQGKWPGPGGMRIVDHHSAARLGSAFADGQPPDLIHAFTPREGVRRFVMDCYRQGSQAALALHLEDHEDELSRRSGNEGGTVPDGLSCPLRWPLLTQAADGVSVIFRTLGKLLPQGTAFTELLPVIDPRLFTPAAGDPALRARLGLRSGEAMLVYCGNDHASNSEDMRDLHRMLYLLNAQGIPARLVRTGRTLAGLTNGPGWDARPFILNLGMVSRPEIPVLLATADLLVQPGRPDAFNDHRLPAKVPEFLASGRPVITGPANLGALLKHGSEAYVVPSGTPEEFAAACRTLLADGALRAWIGAGGRQFALREFSPAAATVRIGEFYERCAWRARERAGLRILSGFRSDDFQQAPEPGHAAAAFFLAEEVQQLRGAARTSMEETEKLRTASRSASADRQRITGIERSLSWKIVRRLYSLEKRLRRAAAPRAESVPAHLDLTQAHHA